MTPNLNTVPSFLLDSTGYSFYAFKLLGIKPLNGMYAFALVVEETLVAVWDVGLLTGSSTERGNLQSTVADREITHGMDVGICVSNEVLASSSLCLAFFVSWFNWYICVV